MRAAKVLACLCISADLPEHSLLTDAISTEIMSTGSYVCCVCDGVFHLIYTINIFTLQFSCLVLSCSNNINIKENQNANFVNQDLKILLSLQMCHNHELKV